MRVVVVLVLLAGAAAACGLSVTGQDPAAATPSDGGPGSSSSSTTSTSSSGTSGGTNVDAGPPVSCADVAGDPTVKKCLDFGEGTRDGGFGFDDLNYSDSTLKPSLSLEPSPLGPAANQSFALNFFGTASTAQKRDLLATLNYPEAANQYSHVSLDVDVEVDRLDNFSWLAALHFAGDGCNVFGGVAVRKSGEIIHLETPGDGQKTVGTYEVGKPFHIRLDAHPGSDDKQPFTVTINGGAPDAFATALPSKCNYGAGIVGNFFASVSANETFHFRFDQLVIRGEK